MSDLALPAGYGLNEYRIESLLGMGGFGLTYLAVDTNLNIKVAIKEYLPADLVQRSPDQSVRSKSQATVDLFNWGRTRFLEESRTIASFRHPNIVRVMRFFQANETAYMVMEFVAGQPLHEWIKRRQPPSEATVLSVALPLLDGLEVVHSAGYLHRDIKPGNIFMRAGDMPVLIDFGSARMAASADLTSIVSPGFAPVEQYHSRGGQGPWSDLYALGGVLYWMITGEQPVEAPARVTTDPMPPAAKSQHAARFGQALLAAVDWALAPAAERRPQSVQDFRRALHGAAVPVSRLATVRTGPPAAEVHPAAAALQIDESTVARLVSSLAAHIGPIASKVVQSQLHKSASRAQLVENLAREIADERTRAAFLKTFSDPASIPPAGAARSSGPPQGSPTGSVSQRFDAATLAKAESDLAQYIGAVARVVVRRAAARARDVPELYHLLAEEIQDPAGKKAFARKGMSISGRD